MTGTNREGDGAILRVLYYADGKLRGFVTTFKPAEHVTPESQALSDALHLCKVTKRKFQRVSSCSFMGKRIEQLA